MEQESEQFSYREEAMKLLETPPSAPKGPWLLRGAAVFLLVTLASVAVNALLYVRFDAERMWRSSMDEFKFLVLASGNSIQVEEVGRYLRQQEGVESVVFRSADEALEKLKQDPTFEEDLRDIKNNPLPPIWQVTWKKDAFDNAHMKDFLQDIRVLPGVLDVSYDSAALSRIHTARLRLLEIKTGLSLALFLGILLAAVLIGRLFVVPAASGKSTGLGIIRDIAAWTTGFFLVFLTLGHIPYLLLAFAVLAAGLSALWTVQK